MNWNEKKDAEPEEVTSYTDQTGKLWETLWRAEQYRARNFPGVCLTPTEIFQLTLATATPKEPN